MKVEIKISCSDITPAEKERVVRFGVYREENGMRVRDVHSVQSAVGECIQSFMQRIIADRDKLIKWKENENTLCATLQIVPPDGITYKDFE